MDVHMQLMQHAGKLLEQRVFLDASGQSRVLLWLLHKFCNAAEVKNVNADGFANAWLR